MFNIADDCAFYPKPDKAKTTISYIRGLYSANNSKNRVVNLAGSGGSF
jgi:hypothetical protein